MPCKNVYGLSGRAIDDFVHDDRKQQCGDHIKEGMLFYKYGRQDDTYHQQKGAGTQCRLLFKDAALTDSQMYTDRVIYMNAGEQICGCIAGIE